MYLKVRISIVGQLKGLNTPIAGGPERALKNIIKGVVKYDKENEYLIILLGFEEKPLFRKVAPNVKIFSIPLKLYDPSETVASIHVKKLIQDIILSEEPDAAIVHDPIYLYFIPKQVRKKTAVVLHGAFWEGLEYMYQRISSLPALLYRKYVYSPLSFLALKTSSLIIAATEYLKLGLPQSLRNKTIVLENPVDDVFFEVLEYRAKRKRLEVVDDEKIQILSIGRYDPRKNYEVLLYAIKKLIEKDKKYKKRLIVKIIGSEYKSFSWYLYKIAGLMQKLGLSDNVTLIENQNDQQLLEHYLQSDIYVHPSLYEGLPNAIQEAMASGLPVVASRVGGIPYVIKDGYNGILFDPQEPEELTLMIQRLVDHDKFREFLGVNAHKTALYRWSLSKYIERLRNMLTRCLIE